MKTLMVLCALVLAGCGKTAPPLGPLDAAARKTCTDTIESRATNRSSVHYIGEDPAVAKNARGELEASVKFSAKNEIGIASTMLAKCTVSADGKTLVNIAVKDVN